MCSKYKAFHDMTTCQMNYNLIKYILNKDATHTQHNTYSIVMIFYLLVFIKTQTNNGPSTTRELGSSTILHDMYNTMWLIQAINGTYMYLSTYQHHFHILFTQFLISIQLPGRERGERCNDH